MKNIQLLFVIAVAVHFNVKAQTQTIDSFELYKNDYDKVAAVYQRNIESYLYKFASNQEEPLSSKATKEEETARQRAIESMVTIYRQNLEVFISKSFDHLSKEKAATYKIEDKHFIIGYFDFSLRIQFPGLDYTYFKKSREDILADN